MKNVIRPLCETISENPKYTSPNLGKTSMCWKSSSKASWRKEEMKESDLKRTPKTLMPSTRVHKPNGSENSKGNLEENQVAHLQGWTTRPTKSNKEKKWWKTWKTAKTSPMMWVSFAMKKTNKIEKGQSNYKMLENELGRKKDHPKYPFDRYQCKIE